jgi:dihydrofolate synthase/folylpolyglutamate synthase
MDYAEAEEYLHSLPRFGIAAGLKNVQELLDKMGNPERELRCVQVAGTNGKGSVTTMIASILQANGLKTGKYLSPHLDRLTERIQVNGQDIPEKTLARMVEQVKELEHNCTFFEVMTAIAFNYFSENAEYSVLEVGLGGRLDATSAARPEVCVITNVGLEHTKILGSSLAEIAWEKSGVIEPGCVVVTAEKNHDALDVIKKVCGEKNARLVEVEKGEYRLSLKGEFQQWNASCAVQAVKALAEKQGLKLKPSKGLSKASIPGRMELKKNVLMDVAHNPDGMRELKKVVEGIPHEKLFVVLGVKNDKDVKKMLHYLPSFHELVLTQYRIAPGGLEPGEIMEKAGEVGLDVSSISVVPNVREAFDYAKSVASGRDLVVVTGSTFTVSESRGVEKQINS